MRRRDFLLGLGWMSLLGWSWAQARPQDMASLLLGERVDEVPADILPDLRLLMSRGADALQNWPEGEAAARRVLLRLLEGRGWEWVPFANAPARPPAQRADWGRPWISK